MKHQKINLDEERLRALDIRETLELEYQKKLQEEYMRKHKLSAKILFLIENTPVTEQDYYNMFHRAYEILV